MNDNFFVTVNFDGEQITFANGSQAYIFHTGVLNDIHIKYGMSGLLKYTAFVQKCYINLQREDSLGDFADYVAENWERVKDMSDIVMLRDYYGFEESRYVS